MHSALRTRLICSIESLPSEVLPEAEYAATGSRYDGQVAVFGRALQAQLEKLSVFLVGAGALGCELLKNLALMGVATGDGGLVTVTDDDTIEKSNLSRQFLFRDWNIGEFKAAVAGAAAQKINPAFKGRFLQNRVSSETEDVFNDEFWQARRDCRCVVLLRDDTVTFAYEGALQGAIVHVLCLSFVRARRSLSRSRTIHVLAGWLAGVCSRGRYVSPCVPRTAC